MKKHNNKKRVHFKTETSRSQVKQKVIDMKPEDLAAYVHRAEKEALPTIRDLELSAGAAIFLLAQYTQVLITGNPRLTMESATSITDNVLALWDAGSYQPGPEYPFTIEETKLDLKNGMKTQTDYSEYFQPFTPTHTSTPLGLGQVAGGIVENPKTHLWQIWIIVDGPCTFFGAYSNPAMAQKNLEEAINTGRRGGSLETVKSLYHKLVSQGDGNAEPIPFDMMSYLIDHLHFYMIEL